MKRLMWILPGRSAKRTPRPPAPATLARHRRPRWNSAEVLRWETLTKKQFDGIDRARAVVLVTGSPLEVHGPHLPLGADCLEGEGLAERMLRFLPERHRDRTFLKLPFVYAAADPVPQPGSLSFRPSTTIAFFEDLGRSLAAQGFRTRAGLELPRQPATLPGARGGLRPRLPRARHRDAVRVLGDALAPERRRLGARRRARAPARRQRRQDFAGDTHGGLVETSQLLALHPDLVDPDYKSLPAPHRRALARGARRGAARRPSAASSPPSARCSAPSARASASSPRRPTRALPGKASAELGEQILDTLARRGGRARRPSSSTGRFPRRSGTRRSGSCATSSRTRRRCASSTPGSGCRRRSAEPGPRGRGQGVPPGWPIPGSGAPRAHESLLLAAPPLGARVPRVRRAGRRARALGDDEPRDWR